MRGQVEMVIDPPDQFGKPVESARLVARQGVADRLQCRTGKGFKGVETVSRNADRVSGGDRIKPQFFVVHDARNVVERGISERPRRSCDLLEALAHLDEKVDPCVQNGLFDQPA